MSTTVSTAAHTGGAWLISSTSGDNVFTPERLSDDHRLMARTTAEFVSNEVMPALDRLEQKDWDLARQLVHRCGELGLLGINVPEAYGGVDLDKAAAVVVAEQMTVSASFGATYGAQGNLTIIPILLFGTDDQKRKYLPVLVSGEQVGAYALSESGSGSDALGAKARATTRPDGGFVLNGEKMWITNGGFADIFIVFAKVDGERFTAFIVERTFPGVSSGKEEHKLGLHGSSTTPLVLQDVEVPAANLLGEIGQGHKVAFTVLNYGRFKLGASTSGGAKVAIAEAARYAAQRKQFGQPIGSFGAIKHKLGEMTAREYAVESMLYRVAGSLDELIGGSSEPAEAAARAALEELAIEASILKVAGSEMLDYVLDENIQIHGGNGYVKDYPAERHYRDARVNRIFEGTNEINRLLIPGMLVRRGLKGRLALIAAAKQLQDEILSPPSLPTVTGEPLEDQRHTVEALKKVGLLVLGAAVEAYGDKLRDEQEVVSSVADVMIGAFASESATLRAWQATRAQLPVCEHHADAAAVVVDGAAATAEMTARQALAAMTDGDALRTQLSALRRLLKVTPCNAVAARRRLADATLSRAGYIFK